MTPSLGLSFVVAYELLKGAVGNGPFEINGGWAGRRREEEPRVRYGQPPAASHPGSAGEERRVLTAALVAATLDQPPPLSYITLYRASPLERIDMIRHGMPASEVRRIFAELSIGQGVGFKALNLSTATVNKKAKHGDTLSPEENERVVGFARLVGQLEAMIQDSGDPAGFDARAWISRWLTEPLPAFGGTRPADLMDTMDGQSLVSAALERVQSGAYA